MVLIHLYKNKNKITKVGCLAEYLKQRKECPICRIIVISVHPSFSLRKLVDAQRTSAGLPVSLH